MLRSRNIAPLEMGTRDIPVLSPCAMQESSRAINCMYLTRNLYWMMLVWCKNGGGIVLKQCWICVQMVSKWCLKGVRMLSCLKIHFVCYLFSLSLQPRLGCQIRKQNEQRHYKKNTKKEERRWYLAISARIISSTSGPLARITRGSKSRQNCLHGKHHLLCWQVKCY